MFAAANAIMGATELETISFAGNHKPFQDEKTEEETMAAAQLDMPPCQKMAPLRGTNITDISSILNAVIFSDAAWSPGHNGEPMPAGIGIYMQICDGRSCSQLSISAFSPPASSAIQAEAYGLLLAVKLAEMLKIHQATFLTDNSTLAAAAAARDPQHKPGHGTIRPQLAGMTASNSFAAAKVFHISRSLNLRAHHHARLAFKLQNIPFSLRCFGSANRTCLNAEVLSMFCVSQYKLLLVKCC